MFRVIPPAVHFVQDTFIAAFLILAPLFLALGSTATLLSTAGGVFLVVYNGITDRPGALYPLISESIHRVLDYAGIVLLLILPWILSVSDVLSGIFTETDRWYFFSVGIVAFALAVFVDFTPDCRGGGLKARLPRWLATNVLGFSICSVALLLLRLWC